MLSAAAFASDPSYDARYSYRFKAITERGLTEKNVKELLDNYEQNEILRRKRKLCAVIAVVGEQRYTSLTGRLKEIYHKRPEDGSDHNWRWFYGDKMGMDRLKVHVARALARCGDDEAEKYVFELAMKLDKEEDKSLYGAFAIRNLKYLVSTKGTDVSNELLFLIWPDTDERPGGGDCAEVAFQELLEIETYTRLTNHPDASKYADLLSDCMDGATPKVRATYDMYQSGRRQWVENYRLLHPKRASRFRRRLQRIDWRIVGLAAGVAVFLAVCCSCFALLRRR